MHLTGWWWFQIGAKRKPWLLVSIHKSFLLLWIRHCGSVIFIPVLMEYVWENKTSRGKTYWLHRHCMWYAFLAALFFVFYFFFYKKRKLLLEHVFVVLNLFLCPCLTFSKYLFAFSAGPSPSACCESWRRLSALSWGRHSLQAHSEVTWIGRGVDSSWGSLPVVSSIRTWLSKHGGVFLRRDADRCSETTRSCCGATRLGLGDDASPVAWSVPCELLNFLMSLPVGLAV